MVCSGIRFPDQWWKSRLVEIEAVEGQGWLSVWEER